MTTSTRKRSSRDAASSYKDSSRQGTYRGQSYIDSPQPGTSHSYGVSEHYSPGTRESQYDGGASDTGEYGESPYATIVGDIHHEQGTTLPILPLSPFGTFASGEPLYASFDSLHSSSKESVYELVDDIRRIKRAARATAHSGQLGPSCSKARMKAIVEPHDDCEGNAGESPRHSPTSSSCVDDSIIQTRAQQCAGGSRLR